MKTDPKTIAYAAIGLAVLYVAYKAVKGAGDAADAVGDALGKVGDKVSQAGGYTWDVLTGREDPVGDAIGWRLGDYSLGGTLTGAEDPLGDLIGFRLQDHIGGGASSQQINAATVRAIYPARQAQGAEGSFVRAVLGDPLDAADPSLYGAQPTRPLY